MDLLEFRQDFINEIEAEATELEDYPQDVFIRKVEDILVNDYSYLSEITPLYYEVLNGTVKYKSMRIDAQSLDLSTNTLNLMYVDYNNAEMQTLNKDFVDKAQRLVNFFENCIKGFFKNGDQSVPEVALSIRILQNYEQIHKIHLFLASTNKLNTKLKTLTLPTISLANRDFQVELDVIDINKIYLTKLSDFQKEEIVIDTADFGTAGIPCIKADIDAPNYEAYLAIVPGTFLSEIYKKHGPRLLEANVRSYLNVRGAVNKGIQGTILNQPNKFFPYNNGISTTARSIVTENTAKGLMITQFTDLQIINGGQTTASLAATNIKFKEKAPLDKIYVQMKLTIIKDEDASNDSEFVRNIAKFANSQNKVTAADLNSNHEFYIRMEEFSRKTYAPPTNNNTYQTRWFFERARGQYDQPKMKMTKAEKETYERVNPPRQVIKKTDIAKYINACDQMPYYVSWGAEVNMTRFQTILEEDWKKDNTKYNVAYYRELMAKAILFKETEKTISHLEWYQEQKAYRAQLVAYSISKLMYEIEKTGYRMNFKAIWEKQAVPEYILMDIAQIARIAYDVFTDPTRPTGNVETYCKNKGCWDMVQRQPYSLSEATISSLIDKGEEKEEMVSAKREQRIDNAVSAIVEIYKLGVEKWESLLAKGKEQGVLSGYDVKMLGIAINYCMGKYTSLGDRQGKEILQIKEKLEEYGIY